MTQRERFIKRNEEFEKMVIGEDMIMNDNELLKNEVYLPINKIPITNPQKDLALIAQRSRNTGINGVLEEEKKEEFEEKKEEFEGEKKEKKGRQEDSFDRKSEEFSIVYTEEDNKQPTKPMQNLSKIISQNKENYLGYKFDEKNDESEEQEDTFDEKQRLPFEVEKPELIEIVHSFLDKAKPEEISPEKFEIKTEEKPERPNTTQIKSIKDLILKEFLSYEEEMPLWSPLKPREKSSPLKSRKNSPKKRQKNIKDPGSELDMYFMGVDDLWSLEDPGFAMHKLLLELKSDKWEDQNNALITIRRLAKNHKEQLYDMNLSIPHLISDICELSNSFNSVVCKQSILTLIDLAETLKGNLDIGLDPIITLIVNKNSLINVFVGDEVHKLMKTVAKYGDGNKIMYIISSILSKTSKNQPFNAIIAQIISLILDKYKTNVIYLKNFPKLIVLLAQLVCDQSYSVRQITKKALFNLLNSQFLNRNEFEEVLKKNLPEKEFQEVKKFIERHKHLIDEKFIEGMNSEFVVHWEENSYQPMDKNSRKERPNSHLLKLNKN